MLCIVTPTYNEEQNIKALVDQIDKALTGVDHRIVVVDDSTDSTPQVVRAMMESNPNITLIHRDNGKSQGGLSTAVLAGFREASVSNYICVIDADLQHPPHKIVELFERAVQTNADIVIASRYIPGGSNEGLNGPLRKLVSIGSACLARMVFPVRLGKITDPLGGFFLFKASLISNAELKPLGFKILLDILMRTDWKKVEEVPYQFRARANGTSKATFTQGKLFLLQLWSIYSDRFEKKHAATLRRLA